MTHDELCEVLGRNEPRCTGKPVIAGFYFVPRARSTVWSKTARKPRCVDVLIWRCPTCGQHIHAYETARPVSFN